MLLICVGSLSHYYFELVFRRFQSLVVACMLFLMCFGVSMSNFRHTREWSVPKRERPNPFMPANYPFTFTVEKCLYRWKCECLCIEEFLGFCEGFRRFWRCGNSRLVRFVYACAQISRRHEGSMKELVRSHLGLGHSCLWA